MVSPKQIVGYCRREGIRMMSRSWIYQYLNRDKKQGLKLYRHTRHALNYRQRRLTYPPNKPCITLSKKCITTRPEEINNKERLGGFKMNLVVGKRYRGAILPLWSVLVNMPSSSNSSTASKLGDWLNRCSLEQLGKMKSITTDNGTKLNAFKRIEKALSIPIYFAKPYCSTDKPHVKYLNKLIRWSLSKKISLTQITQEQCKLIQDKQIYSKELISDLKGKHITLEGKRLKGSK